MCNLSKGKHKPTEIAKERREASPSHFMTSKLNQVKKGHTNKNITFITVFCHNLVFTNDQYDTFLLFLRKQICTSFTNDEIR